MPVLITGGCGFIGTNLAHRLLAGGQPVLLFDNLSRIGSENNLAWLRQTHEAHPELLRHELGDVRDSKAMTRALSNASEVYHLAAHEGPESSLADPTEDFEVNTRGTLNLLNALRQAGRPIPLIYASTSKIYGAVPGVALKVDGLGYRPCDRKFAGVDETRPMDLCFPYACSKAAAESYVLDYARIYGLQAIVFRLGSIYGPHRFGSEEQEWTAHFLIRILRNLPITIYGDGKQVRDLLYIEDLLDAFQLARIARDRLQGQAFNLGGGMANAVSLLGYLQIAGELAGRLPRVRFGPWRLGDAKYYATSNAKFQKATKWAPRVSVRKGVGQLYRWIVETRQAPPGIPELIGAAQAKT